MQDDASHTATGDPRDYYDAHVKDKIKDFIKGNKRVDAAVARLVAGVAAPPNRVLEIGCGIGHVADRLGRTWPAAQIVGVDTSPASIRTAQQLFGSDRVEFVEGRLEELGLQPGFDIVLMMDVLEHVPVASRAALMAELRRLVTASTVVLMTVPTPEFLAWLRVHHPERIQPVDEDITVGVLQDVAAALDLELLAYDRVSIWRANDYAHALLGDASVRTLPPRAVAAPRPSVVARLRRLRAGTKLSDQDRRRQLVTARLGAGMVPPP